MVRKKAELLTGPAEDAEFYVEDEHSTKTAYDEAAEALIKALHDTDGEARILIKRELIDGKSPMQHCGSVRIDKYSFPDLIDYIADQWGSGDYRLQVVDKSGLLANKFISIAKRKQAPKESDAQRAPSIGGEVSHVLQQILSTIERQQQQILDLARSNNGSSKKEMLEELEMMSRILSGNQKSNGNTIEQLRDVIDIANELGFSKQQGDDGLGVFAPVLEKWLEKADIEPVPQRRALPLAQPNPAPSQQQQQANSMNMLIKMGLASLAHAAAKQSDPGAYAQWVVDQLPPDKIREFFADPKGLKQIYQWDPRLKSYEDWVSVLAEHVKHLIGMESAVAHEYLQDNGETDKTATGLGASVEKPPEQAPKPDDIQTT